MAELDTRFEGQAGEYLGSNISVGDLDGDGVSDFVATAAGTDESGTASVWYGPVTGAAHTSLDADISVSGQAGNWWGSTLGLGDLDDDGLDDLILGAPVAEPNGPYSGAAYIFYGGDG